MKYNPDKHHRRSIRLRDYDYSKAGAYFVTICAHNRECLFGEIVNGKMLLNEMGQIVHNEWLNTGNLRKNVELDAFVVMPNHFHGIILIVANPVGAYCHTPLQPEFKSPSKSVGAIVRGFKSTVTKQINEFLNSSGCPVWQRNYYEHIIRSKKEYYQIRKYIMHNPMHWKKDLDNPDIFDKTKERKK